jgi:hypothetical protein
MKFENHEIWQDIMISYVEVVEKIEYVLKTLTCTLFKNRNISGEVSKNLT